MFVSQIFDEASEILATTDSKKVFRKLTQAVQTLMESGHYFHTTQEVDVCTGWDGQTITLPRGIEVPLGVNVDGSPTYFRGKLFQYHVNKGGMYNPVDWAWDDRGFVSTIMDIRQPSQLVAVAEHNADVGAQIRVIGTDSKNRPLRTQIEDGSTIDGLIVPVHAQSDFPLGTIEPDGVTIQTRELGIDPLTRFVSTTAHQMQSGQSAVLTANGTLPSFLYAGNTYYIGVDDDLTIQLYQSQLDANAKNNPIFLQSVLGANPVTLTDSREANLNTAVQLTAAQTITIDAGNSLAFSVGTGTGFAAALPSPLVAGTTYFGQPIDTTNIEIYQSLNDAQNRTNQIYLTGNSGKFNTDIRKNIAPQTLLSFAVPHYYQNGDQVQAYTSGGTLPTPLIAGQNYFVNVIDSVTCSLHTSQSDAIASASTILVNPIIFSDNGTGVNSLVKLLPATATTGTQSQITAAGLQLSTPAGSGAQFQAVVIGSVISVAVSAGGAKYTSTPQVTFSSPPSPPAGSGQIVYPATGYAVMVPDAVNSQTFAVGSIVLTSAGLGYTAKPSISIDAPPAVTGAVQATANCTIQTSFVSSFTRVSGGFGYTQPPQVKITGGGGTGATANASINTTILSIPTGGLTSNLGTATCVVPTGHGFVNNQTIQISGANSTPTGMANYNKKTSIIVPTIDRTISAGNLTGVANGTTATCVLNNHGFSDGQIVTISGVTGAGQSMYNGSFGINVIDTNTFQYQTLSALPTTGATPATGTSMLASIPNPTTFTYPVDAGTPTPAVGTITAYSGNVTSVTIVTQGTGYTSTPVITLVPSTGVFVEFTSTGTLPAPLVAGTAYRAEAPLNGAIGQFTILNADFSAVTISSAPTGNFYVALTRPFSTAFNNYWSGDFSGVTTGQGIYLASDYLLPTGVNNTTQYFMRVINSSTAQIFGTQAQAQAALSVTTGIIGVSALGVGQSYFAIRVPSYAAAYNNLVNISTTDYITDGMLVKFSSTGSLPLPLVSGTDYKIYKSGNNVSVTTTSGTPIVFSNAGIPTLPVGQMSMNIARNFTASYSTKIIAASSIFELGDQISVRPKNGDSLPNGLVESTMASPKYYYVRPIDSNSFELYNTRANALASSSTTGRVSYYTTGDTSTSTFYADGILDPILVKSIQHIEKPETIGYVSLYAFDYGRSNDMALVGQYHPTEVNPKYRRIRIGKPCAWARIIYRVSHPTISSQYDYIPLENERAIIAAVHACDLEDKDFFDQAQKYWQVAINYLRSQHESMEDHAMNPPQINNITYGDYSDPTMF